MPEITRIDADGPNADREIAAIRSAWSLERLLLGSGEEAASVEEALEAVRSGGDRAVADLNAKLDRVDVEPSQFRVPQAEISAAWRDCPKPLRDAIELSARNVRRFQEHIRISPPADLEADGKRLGWRYLPLERVGICIPGASAPLPSTVIMTVVPAQAAGVNEIAVASPPRYESTVHPTILAACGCLGVSEVYRLGTTQATAAFAYGTETIRTVDKIVGPGNVYSQLAKRSVFGLVDIDGFAGPSEILILADETAAPRHVAADMLAQAEHDPGRAMLVSWSPKLVDAVLDALDSLLVDLSRGDGARRCLEEFGAVIRVGSADAGVEIANRFAPEHLHIQANDARSISERCRSAGAIFIGGHSPEASGDYTAGPSHVLPTGGAARFWNGLNCNDFVRATSMIEYDPTALAVESEAIQTLAHAEGLGAHALSVSIRSESRG
jgi:histidinol dehydrogenase